LQLRSNNMTSRVCFAEQHLIMACTAHWQLNVQQLCRDAHSPLVDWQKGAVSPSLVGSSRQLKMWLLRRRLRVGAFE